MLVYFLNFTKKSYCDIFLLDDHKLKHFFLSSYLLTSVFSSCAAAAFPSLTV